MKKEEWNEGLNHIDPDLVEDYVSQRDRMEKEAKVRKARLKWRPAMLSAAALALTAAIVLTVMVASDRGITPPPDDSSGTHNSHVTENLPNDRVQAPSVSPQYHGVDPYSPYSDGFSSDYVYNGISVTARFKGTLSDTYTFYDDWQQEQFRLVRMETVTILKGKEITDEFYYIIPVDYMTDFSLYHIFVLINMRQYGYEHSVVYNVTRGCAEQLDLVLFGSDIRYWLSEYRMMAFDENGILDTRLWHSNEEWISSTKGYAKYYPKEYSLQQAAEKAKDEYHDDFRVKLIEGTTGEAAEVLEYIKSFENGLYVPTSPISSPFFCRRFINGFPTNETISISKNEVTFSEAHFTKEDENNLPDLASAIASVSAACDAGRITPPHFQYTSAPTRTRHGFFGWYVKTPDGVIGIIRTVWTFIRDQDLYYDDAYYIVESGSDAYQPIERDALLVRLEGCSQDYIFAGRYNENGIFNDGWVC